MSASGSPVCNNIKQLPTHSVVVLFDFQFGGSEQPLHGCLALLLLLPPPPPPLLLLLGLLLLLLLLPPLPLLLLDEDLLDDDVTQLGSLMHSETFFGINGTTPWPFAPIIDTPVSAKSITPVLVTSDDCTS
jgi:hypothetical protein